MIARVWRGAVRSEDADAYARYMEDTGIAGYRGTSGNEQVLMLRRERGDLTEFVMVTVWESMEAVRTFAGDDPERAVFYPEDEKFLVERDLGVAHYEVARRAP